MRAAIITIGDEILLGQIVDTNSAFIANKLKDIGVSVSEMRSIADDEAEIMDSLQYYSKNFDFVFFTGGLGPTKDDITKHTVCKFFESKLVYSEESYKNLERLIIPKFGKVGEANMCQAMVPDKATVFVNQVGTAPIMMMQKGKTLFFFTPGVPHETYWAYNEKIIPYIKGHYKLPAIFTRNILTTGIGESFLSEKISDWEDALPENVGLAYLPAFAVVKLRLTAKGDDIKQLKATVDKEVEKLYNIISEFIFGEEDETIQSSVGKLLLKGNFTLSVAESCSGGNIAHLITSVSGSSAYFKGGVVAYSNEVKENLLKVNHSDIETQGAVSAVVVEQMAKGAKALFNTDFAIATSGIAGPTGGTIEKPVGTVWIAVAYEDEVISMKHQFGDLRDINIVRSSITALNMLRKNLLKEI